MNQITIIGRLTKAPETSSTSEGTKKTTFTVAVTKPYNKDQSDFIPVVTWNKLAEICGQYLVKGQRVGVIGSLNTYSYQGNDGETKYGWNINANSVEMLDKPQPKTAASESPYGRSYKPAKKEEPQYNPEDLFAQAEAFPIQEDDLPF